MIPNDFVQTLLGRVDIVDVIDKHVKLKKAGANFMACCPFHSEKSPSFSVSPTKQFYHCFGCGEHGTALGFIMEYAGLGFREAVKELADSVGLAVPEDRSTPNYSSTSGPRDEPGEAGEQGDRELPAPGMAEALRTAFNFYRAELKKSPAAIDYLRARGVSGEIAARFGIGYAPEGWQGLASVFDNYQTDALKSAGLVIDSAPEADKPARRYDRFRERVMFPIFDARQNVIGFGGRVLGKGEPKYLNSPETPLFEKGRELYALSHARRSIRDLNLALVVEGYMDVVALHQSGIENAVATLGTATTPTHLEKLLRMTSSIAFCFDGDKAGRKAAWRALEIALPLIKDGQSLTFLFLPAEDDPDSYVRRLGKAAFMQALEQATPLSEYLVTHLLDEVDLTSSEGKARLVTLAKPLLGQIRAPMLGMLIQRRLAELTGVPAAELAAIAPSAASFQRSPRQPRDRQLRETTTLDTKVLAALLAWPSLVRALDRLEPLDRLHELSLVAEVARFVREMEYEVTTASIYEAFRQHPDSLRLEQAYRVSEKNFSMVTLTELEAEFGDYMIKLAAEMEQRELLLLGQAIERGPTNPEQRARYLELLQGMGGQRVAP